MEALNSARRAAYHGPCCPNCGTLLLTPPERGEATCSCGQTFELAVFQPPGRAAVQPQAFSAGATPCARHSKNAAVASCEHCGAFMCALCRVDTEGQALCATCFERLSTSGKLASARGGFRHYNGIALGAALVGLFPPISVLLGPIAVLAAFKGLRQSRELGEPLGATGAKVAIVLGSLEAVGGVLQWWWVVGLLLKGK